MNLAAIAEDRLIQNGEMVAVFYEGDEITNAEMMRKGRKLAAALKNLGVRRGDRVVLQMPNCPEVLQAFEAVWQIGAVIVPINWLVSDEETAYIYRDSGAKVVVSNSMFLPKIKAAGRQAPNVETVILTDKEPFEGCLSFSDLVEKSPELRQIEETADDDVAALIYTAGTTGRPKGVMHTHYSLYCNAEMQYESVPLPDDSVTVCVLPLCHSFGIAILNNGLFRKAKAVLLNSFDTEVIFSSIEKYKAHVMPAVPTMYIYMLLYPEPHKYDLSSMKHWICGSAPLSMETWKQFKEVYGFEIAEGWGLTEAGANNSVNPFEGLKKVGSIGLPMKGTEMGIMDDGGELLPCGKSGEIVIRGPMLMKGYWGKPEETAEMIRDGWLHTGDVGYMDEDGYYWITDRKKDLIIKGGENISPRTVEEVLFSHPKLSEAAVIAMPDPKYGEEIKAFVVLQPGISAVDPEEIKSYCKEQLGSFFTPKQVVVMPALPKSLIGKVLKRELRKL